MMLQVLQKQKGVSSQSKKKFRNVWEEQFRKLKSDSVLCATPFTSAKKENVLNKRAQSKKFEWYPNCGKNTCCTKFCTECYCKKNGNMIFIILDVKSATGTCFDKCLLTGSIPVEALQNTSSMWTEWKMTESKKLLWRERLEGMSCTTQSTSEYPVNLMVFLSSTEASNLRSKKTHGASLDTHYLLHLVVEFYTPDKSLVGWIHKWFVLSPYFETSQTWPGDF